MNVLEYKGFQVPSSVSRRTKWLVDWYRFKGASPKKAYLSDVAKGKAAKSKGTNASVISRHQQIGNSVSPVVARELGRCLLEAYEK